MKNNSNVHDKTEGATGGSRRGTEYNEKILQSTSQGKIVKCHEKCLYHLFIKEKITSQSYKIEEKCIHSNTKVIKIFTPYTINGTPSELDVTTNKPSAHTERTSNTLKLTYANRLRANNENYLQISEC